MNGWAWRLGLRNTRGRGRLRRKYFASRIRSAVSREVTWQGRSSYYVGATRHHHPQASTTTNLSSNKGASLINPPFSHALTACSRSFLPMLYPNLLLPVKCGRGKFSESKELIVQSTDGGRKWGRKQARWFEFLFNCCLYVKLIVLTFHINLLYL